MAAVIDPADRAFLTSQRRDVRGWAERSAGQFTVAVVYGGVSAEDQLYIAKSPPEQLSVTALSGVLTELGWRFAVLDPCRPEFIAELAGFDVALPNLHGPFGEDGRLQGLLDYLRRPCCGSGVAASAIAAYKILCKQMMATLCGLGPAAVVAAILHEALTRPRYDAPLPVPTFTTRPDRKIRAMLTPRRSVRVPGSPGADVPAAHRPRRVGRARRRRAR
jgi:hypothetical protein